MRLDLTFRGLNVREGKGGIAALFLDDAHVSALVIVRLPMKFPIKNGSSLDVAYRGSLA